MKTLSGANPSSSGEKTICIETSWNKVRRIDRADAANAVIAAPAKSMTFRKMQLPFNDKKKCADMVREELEYSLAFDISDAAWDFVVNQKGEAYAFAMLKKDAEAMGKDRIIDTEITSLARVCLWCGHQNALIIDIGASKTTAIEIADGSLEGAAVIMKGGRGADEKIAMENDCSIEEAEGIKIGEGTSNKTFASEIAGIFRDVRSRMPGEHKLVILTGGCGAAKGVKEKAEEAFRSKVVSFALPEGVSPYTDAAAFGAAIRDRYPAMSVNLGACGKNESKIPPSFMAALAIPLALLAIHFGLESIHYSNMADAFSRETSRAVQKAFPGKKIVRAKDQIGEEIRRLKKSGGAGNDAILDMLSKAGEAAKTAEKPSALKVYDIEVSGSNMTISGEADSISDAERIRESLAESYSDVKLTEGKTLQSKKVKFTIKVNAGKKARKGGAKKQ